MKQAILLLILLCSVCSAAKAQKTLVARFSVSSGLTDRSDSPVSADLTGITVNDSVTLKLYETVKGKEIDLPCQIENGVSPRLWWILSGNTPAGTSRSFAVYRVPKDKASPAVAVQNTGTVLRVLKDGKTVLDYAIKLVYPPKGIDTMYRRDAFIHPLVSPSGNILTQISPKDHYHHVGIWNPWTRVRTGGHVTDFWNLYSHQGTVRFAGINALIEGQVFGGFNVRQEHVDFQGKNREEITLNEVWDVRVWNADPLGGKAWVIDINSFISVPGAAEAVLEAYRYGGGLGFRATADWDKTNSWVNTSEGKVRADADGTRARWADAGGMFRNSTESGIVFFSHPSNRQHPEPMRVWPLDQNGRGDVFFEFCPIRHKDWVLYPGNVYSQKYRLIVYDGKVPVELSEKLWKDYADPPVVTRINIRK
jgi:hypothetical protein